MFATMSLQSLPLIWRPALTISDSENETFLKCSFKNSVSFLLSQVFVFQRLTLSFSDIDPKTGVILAMQQRE